MLKYSSIYGIAAIGAAIVIISGGIDLSPGAVIALASVVTGGLIVEGGWSLAPSIIAGLLVGVVSGLLISLLVITVQLPPFIATLGAMGIVRGGGVHPHRRAILRRVAGARARAGGRSASRSTGGRRS